MSFIWVVLRLGDFAKTDERCHQLRCIRNLLAAIRVLGTQESLAWSGASGPTSDDAMERPAPFAELMLGRAQCCTHALGHERREPM